MKYRYDIGVRLTKNCGILKMSLSALLAVALSVFSIALLPRDASAASYSLSINDVQQAVNKSKYSLAEAESKLAELSSECDQLEAEINEMQGKVDELAEQTMAAQDAMLAGRASLGEAMQHEYRNSSASAMLGVIFGSTDWTQFTKGVDYLSSIMDSQAEEVEKQKQLKAELEEVSAELTKQKDEQESKLGELESKRDEAQQVVDQVSEEVAANTEKLEELKAQAAAISKPSQSATSSSPSTSQQPSSNSSSNSGNASANVPSSSMGGEWRQGPASAYGGSSDPNTRNPGRTATGAICDDSSMGVAVPMAWPNYRSLLGKTVEIRYGGQTVYATVNDCGGMGGGARHLDLQPGVFKAFGFSTCQAWGVRTVSYRFL